MSSRENRTASSLIREHKPKGAASPLAYQALALRRSGLSAKAIAERMGISHYMAQKLCESAQEEGGRR